MDRPDPFFYRSASLPTPPADRPGGPGAQVAQLVEQRTENPRVAGSIPALGTTYLIDFKRFFDLPAMAGFYCVLLSTQ